MIDIINALNHLTWPGAVGLVALCGTVVGLALCFILFMRG